MKMLLSILLLFASNAVASSNCDLDYFADKWVIASVTTVEQAEKKSIEKIERFPDVPQIPFGYLNESWKMFIKKYDSDKDCLLEFTGGIEAPDVYHNSSGYEIRRDDVVIDVFITSVN